MKVTHALATALMLSGVGLFGSAQTNSRTESETSASITPGYTITLMQPSSFFSLDSPILVGMMVTNITNKDVPWSADKDAWYAGFHFLLKKDGREVETTFFHRVISGRQRPDDPIEVRSGSTILLFKPPGLMFVANVDLKQLYQITEPGRYTLEISRIAEDGKTIVYSNKVTVNVGPMPGHPASIAVSMTMDKDHVRVGQSPWAILTVKNLTDQVLEINDNTYRVYVEGDKGEPPTTLVQRMMTGRLRPGDVPLRADQQSVWTISPGESGIQRFQLDYLYDLSAPGRYSVYGEVKDWSSGEWTRTNTAEFEMQ